MLNETLLNNEYVTYIINRFKEKPYARVKDIEAAFNVLIKANNNADGFIRDRIKQAYIMTHYMEPEVEDVVSILLYENHFGNRIDNKYFNEYFEYPKMSEKYLNRVVAVKNELPTASTKEKDTWIMENVCDKMYHSLTETMYRNNRNPDMISISTAYKEAKHAHKGIPRNTGEPYLTHPLKVAKILADTGFESDIIAAALLHDVAEDARDMGHSEAIEYIEKTINPRVAKYVNAVSSVDKQYLNSLEMSEFGKDKAELDEATLEKLYRIVNSDQTMIYALYIKASDRIHNLRTLDGMSSEKIHSKLDETDSGYLPLFKKFGLRYFTDEIEDLTLKVGSPNVYYNVKKKYDSIINNNKELIEHARTVIEKSLITELPNLESSMGCSGFDFELEIKYHKPFRLAKFAGSSNNPDIDITEYIRKSLIPLCDINIILDAKESDVGIGDFSTMFIKTYAKSISEKGLTITKIDLDDFNRFIVYFEDRFRNRFRCCICMREDYLNYTYGNQGANLGKTDSFGAQSIGEKIYVTLRNGETVEIDEGATILDLAFSIHEALGFSIRSATINDEPVRIFSKIRNKDKVVIEADTKEENGILVKFIPHARISWLKHVKTPQARDRLIKYFERQYEGDDPQYEYTVKDRVIETVLDKLFNEPCLANMEI